MRNSKNRIGVRIARYKRAMTGRGITPARRRVMEAHKTVLEFPSQANIDRLDALRAYAEKLERRRNVARLGTGIAGTGILGGIGGTAYYAKNRKS